MKENNKKGEQGNNRLALGLCLGLIFGIIFDNLALGLCLGVAFGTVSNQKKRRIR